MKIMAALLIAAGLAYVWGVRVHPERFSDPQSFVTFSEKDNLLMQWGILKPKSKLRVPGSVGDVWGAKPQAKFVSTPSQPTASQTSKKASDLARKATYASQF